MAEYKWNPEGGFYIGLTTDTRPTNVRPGMKAYEINLDTGVRKTYQTPDGGTTWVEISNDSLGSVSLEPSTNLIGKTGIDQTTDGTTNRVVAKISQESGENLVQLAGRKLQVGQHRQVYTTNVAAGTSSIITISPSAGYIGRLRALAFSCTALPGATTGSHKISVYTYAGAYLVERLYYTEVANGGAINVTAPSIKALIDSIPFSVAHPLNIAYSNNTDVDSGSTVRFIYALWEEEAIV